MPELARYDDRHGILAAPARRRTVADSATCREKEYLMHFYAGEDGELREQLCLDDVEALIASGGHFGDDLPIGAEAADKWHEHPGSARNVGAQVP